MEGIWYGHFISRSNYANALAASPSEPGAPSDIEHPFSISLKVSIQGGPP